MTCLVDANVLCEATRPSPDPKVIPGRNERHLTIDPVIWERCLRPGGLAEKQPRCWSFEQGRDWKLKANGKLGSYFPVSSWSWQKNSLDAETGPRF